MTRKRYAILLLVLSILFAGWRHLVTRPDAADPDAADAAAREYVALQYLAVEQTRAIEFDILADRLRDYWQSSAKRPALGEAVALIFGLEQRFEIYDRTLAEIDGLYDRRLLDYALERAEDLPDDWRDGLADDWAGHKIIALVSQRTGDQAAFADALIALRTYESHAARYYDSFIFLEVLEWLGLGLLFSMWLIARRRRLEKRRYFLLRPLFVAPASLFRFCGAFLLAFIAVGMVAQVALAEAPVWARLTLTYFAQASAGVFLIKKTLYDDTLSAIVVALGFGDLKMYWHNIFQIIGGVAILTAFNQAAASLSRLISWPEQSPEALRLYGEILQEPLSGTIFIVTVCIVAPVFEEILFRGIVFRGLLASQRLWVAISLSSLLFAMLHPLPYWPAIFSMGVALSLIYHRTGNIVISIWAHALWNCLMLYLTMVETGF